MTKQHVVLLASIPERNWYKFEVTLPRILLAELNTHRQLARNAASSRAIPVTKMQDFIASETYVPEFASNQAGMSPGARLTGWRLRLAHCAWWFGSQTSRITSKLLSLANVHKQWANRPCEWFSYTKVILSGTEWENFLTLRCHETTQVEFREVAKQIKQYVDSGSTALGQNPRVFSSPGECPTLQDCITAVAKDARGTYLNQTKPSTPVEDRLTFSKLATFPLHASPMEHTVFVTQDPNARHGCRKGVISFREFMENAYDAGWVQENDMHFSGLERLFTKFIKELKNENQNT